MATDAITTKETFETVVADEPSVLHSDERAWTLFRQFLGLDQEEAWFLLEMEHTVEKDPKTGRYFLVSKAKWIRDADFEPNEEQIAKAQERWTSQLKKKEEQEQKS